MKKKLLMVLVSLFILTGCSVDYSITFDKNMKVNETMHATETDEFYSNYPNSSYQRVISFILEPNLDFLNHNDYNVNIEEYNGNKGVKIERDFLDFNEFRNISLIYLQAVDGIEFIEDGSYITLKAKVSINTNEQDQERYYVSNLKLNIELPFVVKDSNADKVKKNVYTWNFDANNNNREIIITFNKDKLNINYKLYIMIAGVILFILLVYFGIKYRVKTRNNV